MTKPPRSAIDNARLQGIACALAEVADSHMEPDLARMVLESMNLSIADLKKAGADKFDIERLTATETEQVKTLRKFMTRGRKAQQAVDSITAAIRASEAGGGYAALLAGLEADPKDKLAMSLAKLGKLQSWAKNSGN